MVTTTDVINSFFEGKGKCIDMKACTVSTRDGKLFSYGTVIAEFAGDTVFLNVSPYRVTMVRLQYRVKDIIIENDMRVSYFTDIELGTTTLQLWG